MSTVDDESLRELAEQVRALLDEAGIEIEMFGLTIRVPREFYQSIKANFPNRHAVDLIVGTKGSDWSIDLLWSVHEGNR